MNEPVLDYDEIERELRLFEAEERRRLGIEEEQVEHWHDDPSRRASGTMSRLIFNVPSKLNVYSPSRAVREYSRLS